ncbi:MFS transporter [Pararobbsia silviterrae]|uniref:MFS transporter n=1 Tax=Pararobbsia silviterrae TaxID=1792498 RepID=UPI001F0C2062|nr:MFS transporter [Pararobbsia silviterrae]
MPDSHHSSISSLSAARRARLASMGLFFTAGWVFASWGVHVPTVKEKFGLDDAQLSVALFAVAGGSIVAMPKIGKWAARVGTRAACTVGGLGACIATSLILLMPWYWPVVVLLAMYGALGAALDVSMNTEAADVEAALGKPIVSSLHGMFSLGGLAGAAAGGFALSHGMAPALHFALASAVGAAIILVSRPYLLPHVAMPEPTASEQQARARAHVRRGVLALGILALVALIAEGAMYDWSTVYMRDVVHASTGIASAAYAAFSGGMALGRFSGDAVRARVDDGRLVVGSGILASGGMVLGLLVPTPWVALAGFALMGLGLSNMMPVMFLAAARVPGLHAAEGVARVAAMAYIGLLIGPVLIGVTAHATTLPIGMSVVIACAALVAAAGPYVLRPARREARAVAN